MEERSPKVVITAEKLLLIHITSRNMRRSYTAIRHTFVSTAAFLSNQNLVSMNILSPNIA
jgi:hypothetical protein